MPPQASPQLIFLECQLVHPLQVQPSLSFSVFSSSQTTHLPRMALFTVRCLENLVSPLRTGLEVPPQIPSQPFTTQGEPALCGACSPQQQSGHCGGQCA